MIDIIIIENSLIEKSLLGQLLSKFEKACAFWLKNYLVASIMSVKLNKCMGLNIVFGLK